MQNKIPEFILKELAKIKVAKAVLLTGSRALGKESKNSDWDFVVILENNSPRWRKTYKLNNEWIELLCNSKEQIEKEFLKDLNEGRGATTYMFATGIIIKDTKDKILQRLVSKAKKNWSKGPKKLAKKEIELIGYQISTLTQDIEDCLDEENKASLLVSYAVAQFINYYYRLGNTWLIRPKDRLEDIKKNAPELYDFIVKLEEANDWHAKAKLVISMGKSIGHKYGLKLNGELFLPPENKK